MIKNGTPPPIPFEDLVATMMDDKQILDSITDLLSLKRRVKDTTRRLLQRAVSQLFFIVITKVFICQIQ